MESGSFLYLQPIYVVIFCSVLILLWNISSGWKLLICAKSPGESFEPPYKSKLLLLRKYILLQVLLGTSLRNLFIHFVILTLYIWVENVALFIPFHFFFMTDLFIILHTFLVQWNYMSPNLEILKVVHKFSDTDWQHPPCILTYINFLNPLWIVRRDFHTLRLTHLL